VTRTITNTDANRPSLDAGAITMTILNVTTQNIVHQIIVTNSAARATVKGITFNAGLVYIRRCKASASSNIGFDLSNGNAVVEDCEANACTTSAGFNMGSGTKALRCTANSCTSGGFLVNIAGNTLAYLDGCVANACTGAAGFFNSGGSMFCTNCLNFCNTAQDGFRISTGSYSKLESCYAEGSTSTGVGFDVTAAGNGSNCFLINCAGFNNAGGNNSGFGPGNIENFQALSASGLTNPAGNDFSTNTTAGAGALLRAGWVCRVRRPHTKLPGLSTNSYPDIGAAQAQANNAGGFDDLPRPLRSGLNEAE
jgi:hypothetical protein